MWTDINHAYAQQLAVALAERRWRVLRMNVPPHTDPAELVPALLQQAEARQCDQLVEGSLFLEDEGELIVVRLRLYPVLRQGSQSRIGAPRPTLRREFPNTQSHRDRLVPARLAEQLAQELVAAVP